MKVPLIAAAFAVALSLLVPCFGAPVLTDTFADGNSQNQDLANHSLRYFNGRSTNVRTDAVGSFSLDVSSSTSSEAIWAFFTPSGSPINLSVGESLSVSVTFSLTGFKGNGSDIRFGLLNSNGTRNTTNLTGGMNDATFAGDLGYAVSFAASGSGAPFTLGKRSATPSSPNNPFNSFGDFPTLTANTSGATTRSALMDGPSYTLTFTVHRVDASNTTVSVAVASSVASGPGSLPANYSWTATDTSNPYTAFDTFGFRVGGSNFANKLTFTRVVVDYVPSVPQITQQPTPAVRNVSVGGQVSLSVLATGVGLQYQWLKDGADLPGATAASLTLANVQSTDAGVYRCRVSNGGGAVLSDAVTVNVVNGPVDTPPSIVTQPAAQSVQVGGIANFSVQAAGSNLTYQWLKNGSPIAGATGASLAIPSVQVADRGDYSVVVSNGGGSVPSNPAALTVLSAMSSVSFAPANGSSGRCIDTPLAITFSQTPVVGTTGRIRVLRASDNQVVDTIDLSLAQQQKVIGGFTYNYRPVIVSGNTANIYLHSSTVLAYGETYYVTVEPGAFTDSAGAFFSGISDPSAFRFSTKAFGPPAGTSLVTVAADGTGDFCTVQGAVDFVPSNNTARVTISIKAGTYTELVHVPSGKNAITLRGAGRQLTTLAYANNNNFNPAGTIVRCVLGVDAHDFVLEEITVHNTTPAGGSQAEAFRTGNNVQRCLVHRTNLISFQDTILASGQTFFSDCYVEGDVDFMWGGGACYFQRCTLKAVRAGYYTQIRNDASRNGNVYVECRLTGAANLTGVYLSRIDPNVFPFSQVVWIDCAMGSHIAPAGWLLNNATAGPTLEFWEYRSTDLNGNLLDVSQRHPVSRQLTDAEAVYWRDPMNVLGWAPSLPPVIDTPPSPVTVNAGQPIRLTVAATLGNPKASIQWYKDGTAIPAATASELLIPSASAGDIGSYTVALSNAAGTVTSPAAAVHVITPTVIVTQPASQTVVAGSDVTFTVSATGQPPFSYQWFKGGAAIAGATGQTLTLQNVQGGDAGTYSVKITSPTSSATSAGATLTVTDPYVAFIAQHNLGANGAANGDPDADGMSNLLEFVLGGDPASADVHLAPKAKHVSGAAGDALVFEFTRARRAVFLDVDVEISADLQQWTRVADGQNGVSVSTTPLDAVHDRIAVTVPMSGPKLFARIGITGDMPSIVTHPQDTMALHGGSAQFKVSAGGLAPLTYQWFKDGQPVVGATGDTLTIVNVGPGELGSYSVQVANSYGSVASSAAQLQLSSLPPVSSLRLIGFASLTTGVTGGGLVDFANPGANYLAITAASSPTPAHALKAALESNAPMVIELQTDVDLGVLRNISRQPLLHPDMIASGVGRINVRSNKTLYSVHGATLKHGTLNIDNQSNIIIRNLKFRELWEWDDQTTGDYDLQGWDYVAITNGAHHVWVDHCDFEKAYDGLLDVTQGADLVTISWCRFSGDASGFVKRQIDHLEALYQSNPSDPKIAYYASRRNSGASAQSILAAELPQKKGSLIGSADNNEAVDAPGGLCYLNVTLHHNYYVGVADRAPRMRYGNAHVLNAFMDQGPGNGSASTTGAAVYVENSYFRNVRTPIRFTAPGKIVAVGSVNDSNGVVSTHFANQNPADASQFLFNPPKAFTWTDLTKLPYPYVADANDFTKNNLHFTGVLVPTTPLEAAQLREYLIRTGP
jgi:pectate lyase